MEATPPINNSLEMGVDEFVQNFMKKFDTKLIRKRQPRTRNKTMGNKPKAGPSPVTKVVSQIIVTRPKNPKQVRKAPSSCKLDRTPIDSSDSENEWAFPERYGTKNERKKRSSTVYASKKMKPEKKKSVKREPWKRSSYQWKEDISDWNFFGSSTKVNKSPFPATCSKVQLIDWAAAAKIRAILNVGVAPKQVLPAVVSSDKQTNQPQIQKSQSENQKNQSQNQKKQSQNQKKQSQNLKKQSNIQKGATKSNFDSSKSKKKQRRMMTTTVPIGSIMERRGQCLFEILEHAIKTGNEALQRKTLEFIAQYTYDLLYSQGFFNVTPSTLNVILARDDLTVKSELALFNAVASWGRQNCYRWKTSTTGRYKSMSEVLIAPLKLIRFCQMSEDDLRTGVFPLQFIPSEQLQNIFYCCVRSTARPEKLKSTRRNYFDEAAVPKITKGLLKTMLASLFQLEIAGSQETEISLRNGGHFYLNYLFEEWKQLTLLHVLNRIPPLVSHIVVLCENEGTVKSLRKHRLNISREVYAAWNKFDEKEIDTYGYFANGGVMITTDDCWKIDSNNTFVIIFDMPGRNVQNGQRLGIAKRGERNNIVLHFMRDTDYPVLKDFQSRFSIKMSPISVDLEFDL